MSIAHETTGLPERAVLVATKLSRTPHWQVEESLKELKKLALSAGVRAVTQFVQERERLTPAFHIGEGKAREIGEFCLSERIDVVIFDDELTPAQQRNLEKLLCTKVIDRTQLILDIFAQRARTREGKLQVELAQLTYMLPRLAGKGKELSRLGGGIGTRGPGETKLEMDRRRIRLRIAKIKASLKEVQKTRKLHRECRRKQGLPTVALIGYTNSGKSTLMNRLTSAGVPVANQLFSTLDPTIRSLILPNDRQALLSDTVGFIQKLPHQLVAAFKATLEEVVEADLLVHVIDCSHPEMEQQIRAVYEVLKELESMDKPLISVYNKIDAVSGGEGYRRTLSRERDAVVISALNGQGLEELKRVISYRLRPVFELQRSPLLAPVLHH